MSSLKDPEALYGEGSRSRLGRAPFATPDNLESAAVYLQSSLKSFGFSGRVNFLSSAPEDISNTFNCVYYLLEKFQKEQGKNEDTSTEVKRLRNELHVGENVYGRLKKDLEMRERDIGTMMIKERQAQSAYQEQLAVVTRDKEVLNKKCNNLSRRQVQFQHEIRRKEVEYQRLQDKLRYYLAEKKREAKASMEIVGRLRQQSQSAGRGSFQLDDDLLKNARSASAKFGRSNGKLDENLVKMIVRAYEDKQRDLMMENKDLRAALNSLQREYAQLLNARMGEGSIVPQSIRTGVVPVSVTGDPHAVQEASMPQAKPMLKSLNSDTMAGSTSSVTPRGTESDVLARTPSARTPCASAPSSPREHGNQNAAAVVPKAEEIAEALINRKDVHVTPSVTSDSHDHLENEGGSEEVDSHQPEATTSEKSIPQGSADEFGIVNPSISSLEKEDIASTEDTESFQENEPAVSPKRSPKPRAIHGSISNDLMDIKPAGQGSPLATSPFARNQGVLNGKSAKFAWPPPPPSSPPGGSTQSSTPRSPRRLKLGKLGRLPTLSKKKIPNFSKMTEDQLKQELRSRALEVEEAVVALRAACGSMNPQDMRGVLEKRLHMELVMAANLAEQQEAIVNLALIGMEKTLRSVGSGELPDSEEERAKLMVSQVSKLCQNLNGYMAEIPEESIPEPVKSIVVELEEKAALAAEEYDNVKVDLVVANKKIKKLQRSLESSTHILNESMSAIAKRSAKLAHEQEYLSQLRRDLGDLQEEELNPELSPLADGAPKKGRQTWAEKAQNSSNADPFDDLSEDFGTPSTTGKFTSPRSVEMDDKNRH